MNNTYHTREFLNPLGHKAWSSIQCFYGYGNPENEMKEFQGKTDAYVIIQGCHESVTLHKTSPEMKDFITKLRLLTSEINNFADWLENNE